MRAQIRILHELGVQIKTPSQNGKAVSFVSEGDGTRTRNHRIDSVGENATGDIESEDSSRSLGDCLPNGADSGGPIWPEIDAEPPGGIDGTIQRLADGTRRLCE
jgi:hypothetical protein